MDDISLETRIVADDSEQFHEVFVYLGFIRDLDSTTKSLQNPLPFLIFLARPKKTAFPQLSISTFNISALGKINAIAWKYTHAYQLTNLVVEGCEKQ